MTRLSLLVQRAVRQIVTRPRDALLSLRMAFWVIVVTATARLTSLPRAQKIAAFRLRSTAVSERPEDVARLGQIIDTILGIDLFVFRRSCWKRALVLHRFLMLRGIESQIRFGVKRESDGKVDGHAWLERDGSPLLEENASGYVVTFSLPSDDSRVYNSEPRRQMPIS
jgi:hypothetical protein